MLGRCSRCCCLLFALQTLMQLKCPRFLCCWVPFFPKAICLSADRRFAVGHPEPRRYWGSRPGPIPAQCFVRKARRFRFRPQQLQGCIPLLHSPEADAAGAALLAAVYDPPTPEDRGRAFIRSRSWNNKTMNSASQAQLARSNFHPPSMDAGAKSKHLNALLVLLQVVGPSCWG